MSDAGGGRGSRFEITGHDIDAARAMFQDDYHGDDFVLEPTAEPFSYRYTSAGDDEVTLRGNLFSGSVKGSIRTEGEYVVSWITAGSGATDLDVDPVRLQLGRPAMFVNDRSSTFDFRDFRQNLMHFDGRFLERIASDHEGATGPLLFDATAVPAPDALRRWATAVSTVARVAYDPSSSALLHSDANREVAIALLDTFPHTWLHAPTEITIPAGGRVRTAIEFLHANAHLPVRADEIAEAAGLSLRGLQSAFRRELGLSPLDYLRRIRLDRVRQELRDGDAGNLAVAEVARRWGFAHLGRFSASYAERFGENPRNTLNR